MKNLLPILLSASTLLAQEPNTPTPAAEHHHEGTGVASAGRKMELVAGITEADFLRLSVKPKTVEVIIVAVWNDENYGMNFNGHAKGSAIYTIPKGWTIEVTYINPSPIPHSLIVLEKDAATHKIQMPEPYFKGAAVPNHLQGLAYAKSSFSFTPDEAGEYAFACGFPAHAMSGHWIGLDIDEKATAPTLKLGSAAAQPASPAKTK